MFGILLQTQTEVTLPTITRWYNL